MSFGHGQFDMVYGDAKLVQLPVGFWHEIDESCVQTTRSYSLQLLQTRRGLKLQFRVRLLLPESPERDPDPPFALAPSAAVRARRLSISAP